MDNIIRWGIIGPGKIARKFADDLRHLPQARLHAVASSSLARAQAFADEYEAPYAYGNHDDIVQCPGLDVVYVATTHNYHVANTLHCLERGIPVLCEKPWAMGIAQAQAVARVARERGVFLMEGLWTLFTPGFEQVLHQVTSGQIGQVRHVHADFAFQRDFEATSRLFDPALGGSALLDVGIYPALLALSVLGKPDLARTEATATFAATGVDAACSFRFHYPDGATATGHASFLENLPVAGRITGSEGHIELHPRFHHPEHLTVVRHGATEQLEFPFTGWGYAHEAAHVMACLQEGLTESPRASLDRSLTLTEMLAAVQGAW